MPRFEGRSTLETWVYRFCALTLLDTRRARDGAAVQFDVEPAVWLRDPTRERLSEHDAVLRQATALDPRVRVIRMPANGGTYVARNAGLDAAAVEQQQQGMSSVSVQWGAWAGGGMAAAGGAVRRAAAIGLGAVFIHLRASINWHRLFEGMIEGFDVDALAARQQTALQEVELA